MSSSNATVECLRPFSEELFQALSWINCHHVEGSVDDKQIIVASVVSKLRIYVEQINFALEKTCLHVINILQPIINDIHLIHNEINVLTGTMNRLQNEVGQVNNVNTFDLAYFERLEKIFQKLKYAKHGIQKYDGWSQLTNELEVLLEQNDVQRSADKLCLLKSSFSAQNLLPGQKKREQQLTHFTNRIETMLSSTIMQSILNNNSSEYMKQTHILSTIGRVAQGTLYYRTVHVNNIIEEWVKVEESTGDFLSNLVVFHEYVLHFLHQQQRWCSRTDIDSMILLNVIIDSLLHINNRRNAIANKCFEQHSNKFVFLFELSQANVRLVTILENNLNDGNMNDELIDRLSQAVFGYAAPLLNRLFKLEEEFSKKMLMDIDHLNIADSIYNLNKQNLNVAKWTEDAILRCKQITRNQGLSKMIHVLRQFLETYIEQFNYIHQKTSFNNFKQTDWNLIHSCINMLQSLGALLQNLNKIACTIIEYTEDFYTSNNKLYSSMLDSNDQNNDIVLKIHSTGTKDKSVIFPNVIEVLRETGRNIHDTVMKLMLCCIEQRFDDMRFTVKNTCGDLTLPNYSYAPQEYVTQIGQYLLTLPQHLEPLLLAPPLELRCIMDYCDQSYKTERPCADVLLSLIVAETIALYQDKIDSVHFLSTNSAKQLAVDIEYFLNVLEEISLPCNNNLQQTATLLMLPSDEYNTLSIGCDPVLVTKIRQKRNIISC